MPAQDHGCYKNCLHAPWSAGSPRPEPWVNAGNRGSCTTASLPQRTRPVAIVHSKTARFSGEAAARTNRTARISSTVSMTMIGVEESINIFSRSRTSGMIRKAKIEQSVKLAQSTTGQVSIYKVIQPPPTTISPS